MGQIRWLVFLGLAAFFLAGISGCGKETPSVPPPPLETFPPLLAEMPATPVGADEGQPGVWEPLPGLTPPARAFLVEPTGNQKIPGILLVHSHRGVTRDIRRLARQLSDAGFLVVAPDLLDGLEASSRLALKDLQSGINPSRARETLRAGFSRLKAHPRTEGQSQTLLALAVGGHWALDMGNPFPEIKAMAFDSYSFQDQDLVTLSSVGCPVQLLVGTENSAFPKAKTEALTRALADAKVPFELTLVPMSGTDLLDSQAPGFSPAAREEAITQVLAFFGKAVR